MKNNREGAVVYRESTDSGRIGQETCDTPVKASEGCKSRAQIGLIPINTNLCKHDTNISVYTASLRLSVIHLQVLDCCMYLCKVFNIVQ